MKVTNDDSENSYCTLKKQIIQRRVDPTRIVPDYYQQVKHDIKRKINPDTELLIIEIIPKSVITQQWIVETLMYLQREFTSFITIPKNSANIKKEDFEEFERHYECVICYN